MNDNKKELIDKMNSLIDKPAGKQAARFILTSLGAVPYFGGIISAGSALWGEIEQHEFNETIANWANKTDQEIETLLGQLNNLLQTPTKAKLALIIGEIMGNDLANQFLSKPGNQIPMVLNSVTVNELHPFVDQGWLGFQSTGSVCSMGALCRVGKHVEELKRPYGMGSGFVLTIRESYFV